MSSVILMPELQIGNIIEVKWETNSKFFELDDIACWNKNHAIKTINMIEKDTEYWSFKYDTKKEYNDYIKKLKNKAKLIFKHNDKLLVKCSHDAVPYVVEVSVSRWNGRVTNWGVRFRKMMST